MTRIWFSAAVAMVLQIPPSVGERIVDPGRLGPFTVLTPIDSTMLQFAVGRLTGAAGVPLGLELAPEPVLDPYVSRRRPARGLADRLAGEELHTALDAVIDKVDGYRWEAKGPVVNVRPTRPASFLDLPQRGAFVFVGTAQDVVQAVHRHLNPQYIPQPNPYVGLNQLVGSGHTLEEIAAVRSDLLRRPITVSMSSGASAAEILNEVVRAHGAAAWVVDYSQSGWRYEAARISIVIGHGHPFGYTWTLSYPAVKGD